MTLYLPDLYYELDNPSIHIRKMPIPVRLFWCFVSYLVLGIVYIYRDFFDKRGFLPEIPILCIFAVMTFVMGFFWIGYDGTIWVMNKVGGDKNIHIPI